VLLEFETTIACLAREYAIVSAYGELDERQTNSLKLFCAERVYQIEKGAANPVDE
jgi:hypothetical protein